MVLFIFVHFFLLLTGMGAFLLSVFSIFNHSKAFHEFYHKMNLQHSYYPKVSVLAPVRGCDGKFEENIASLLRQDYPKGRWKVLFIVDEDDSKTERKVKEIIKKSKSRNAHIIKSVPLLTCSGKNAAMITGVKHAEYDVIAGYDSDARVGEKWLASLVGPLEDKSVGATTSFRFYLPSKHFVSYILSAWNSIGYISMKAPHAFVWGGSFAIRKNFIKKANMLAQWAQSVSEDTIITGAVKKSKLSIYFVPDAVAISHPSRYSHITEFTTRQVLMVRWSSSKAYKIALVLFAFSRLTIVIGIAALYLFFATGSSLFLLESFLLLWPIVFGLFRASMDLRNFRVLVREEIGSRLKWVVADFCAQWLMFYNLLRAWRKHVIEWRGSTYDFLKEVKRIKE